MLNKIKNLKCSEIELLASFANVNPTNLINGGSFINNDFKYEELLKISNIKENRNNEMSVSGIIDDLMFDNYTSYIGLMKMKDEYGELMKGLGVFYINQYLKLYENLLLNTKFENADIRSIQKQFVEKKLNDNLIKENYEECSILRDKLNEI